MEKEQPKALITYICTICGSDRIKLFELYTPWKQGTKFCSTCGQITLHKRALPDDDHIKHYQRPSLF